MDIHRSNALLPFQTFGTVKLMLINGFIGITREQGRMRLKIFTRYLIRRTKVWWGYPKSRLSLSFTWIFISAMQT